MDFPAVLAFIWILWGWIAEHFAQNVFESFYFFLCAHTQWRFFLFELENGRWREFIFYSPRIWTERIIFSRKMGV